MWTPVASICSPLMSSLSPFDGSVKMFCNWLLTGASQEESRGHRVCSSMITQSSLVPDAAKCLCVSFRQAAGLMTCTSVKPVCVQPAAGQAASQMLFSFY